ncbi:hypothetical protein [Bacillus sp. MMSF_3328]|uniref:hypothetical protein n=1 Tax=Bacillus sp. MMSF_3328 TaxID=3047080 RepID=UPI00273D968E|nr:hypothetical protein [Bacillus sp. MMSF_3328]
MKAWDGTYPDTIAEVMSLNSPYSLMGGWRDLGATTEGITINRSFETEDFTVDQVSGPVDTDITGWTHSLTTNLAENTVENRQLALIGGTIIETAPVLGTSTTTASATTAGGTILNLTEAAGFTEGQYLQVGGETYRIASVTGSAVTLTRPVTADVAAAAAVSPVTELATRRIGYGSVNDIPFYTYALISQKKDGSLYMAVFRKCKITGDDKEQVFGAEKRVLPLGVAAYPDGSQAENENVYYEIEQVL